MKTRDLKDIKLGGSAFDSKWWEKRRSSACKKADVGKALDAWNRYCRIETESFEDSDELGAAKMACMALKTQLSKAGSLCGRSQKETKDAIRAYEKVVAAYEKDLARVEKGLAADEQDAKNLNANLKKARNMEMFYGLVRKGQEGMLFVSKKQPPIKRLTRKAKTSEASLKGGRIFLGVCRHGQGKLRFHFEEKPPNLRPLLRRLLVDSGMKPAIVVNGVEVDYPEDEPSVTDEMATGVGDFFAGIEAKSVEQMRNGLEKVRHDAVRGVGALQKELLATGDRRAMVVADIVKRLALDFPTQLESDLKDLNAALLARDTDRVDKLRSSVKSSAGQLANFLKSNALTIQGCEKNPWDIPVNISEPVQNSLKATLKATS